MDPLSLIPENLTNHEVASSIRANLQTELDGHIYPRDISENYVQNIHVEEVQYLVNNAKSVENIYKKADEDICKAQLASANIMVQQAKYLMEKEKMSYCSTLQEMIKLKRCDLFRNLETEFVTEYNLIQSSDLLPDLVRRYLDYRDGNSAPCVACNNKIKTTTNIHQMKKKIKTGLQEQRVTSVRKYTNNFRVIPSTVFFHNYELGQTYQKTVKIINTGPTLQSIGLETLPTSTCFNVMLNNNKKLAAGMSVTATVTFTPRMYRTLKDSIRFKNKLGEYMDMPIFATRDVPKLISCVFKSNTSLMEHSQPYCRFEEKRREALNSTIDCGSCLVSQYMLISVIVENRGIASKFFFITEDSWFFKNIDDISSSMELFKGDFWIYPIYFKIEKGEIVEISIIFQPTKPGLHVETLYLMCDNNTFQQIELVGDAIEFSKKLIDIKIPPTTSEITDEVGYTVFLGHVYNKITKTLTIGVRNKSAIALSCEWKFRNNQSCKINDIQENWIIQKCFHANIAPYTSVEFDFDISLDAKTSGYHSIFFCFYILNIPLISLKEGEDFNVIQRENICGKALSEVVDVLCAEIEVCVLIETEKDSPKCLCVEAKSPLQHKPRLVFSCPFVNFGILPFGLHVQKELFIRNNSDQKMLWKILEVEYNIDVPPYFEIINKPEELSNTYGVCNPGGYNKLLYKILDKSPRSYMSILILLDADLNTKIEDICIITYEIINFDIQIKTNQTSFPILCPLEIVYRGVPTELQFSVENNSLITGFFQFLSPFGEDIDKMVVKLNPSSSVIKPLETITITAQLLCKEIGLFEDFYIPCFVGLGQKPIPIKVLCLVEGPRLIFYLPVNTRYFKQVTWPTDVDFCNCEECFFEPEEEEEEEENFDYSKLSSELNGHRSLTNIQKNGNAGVVEQIFPDTITDTLPMRRIQDITHPSFKSESSTASTSSSNKHFRENKLKDVLMTELDDVFFHGNIIEVYDVPVFTPTNVSIFIENVTPLSIRCNIAANNFPVKKNFEHISVRLRLKKNEDIWNDLMGTDCGIVVHPEVDQKEILPRCNAKIDFWIYANTFGVYTEEIVIEVAELPNFYISLLIEVTGCPIQVPFTLNSITKAPTIRFGTISVNSPEIKRSIKVNNVSSIPVHVFWQCYQRKSDELDSNHNEVFSFLSKLRREEDSKKTEREVIINKYFGGTTEKFLDVYPMKTYLKPHSSSILDIMIKPHCSQVDSKKMNVSNVIIGLIHVDLDYMKKSNYYFRNINSKNTMIQLYVDTHLQIPSLEFDSLGNNYFSLDIYANDILLEKRYEFKEYAVLKNTSVVPLETELTVEYPFYFKMHKKGPIQSKRIFLKPLGISELTVYCILDPSDLYGLSYLLYQEESDSTYVHKYDAKFESLLDKYNVDMERKILCITKKITAARDNDTILKEIPINLSIYYPHISVKPSTVKFGNVLINQTYKDMITVFNHTGSRVKFTINKSSEANCFFINPHYGEIPSSTGSSKQCVNIFIYFQATECRNYSESIRVVTNIPNYFMEIYLKGTGTINEKFVTSVKI